MDGWVREPWPDEVEEAPLTTVLALLPIWACFAVAFSTFVTAFAIIASTQALLYWETIHWPWSRLKRSPKELPAMWDPTSLASSKLQYDSLQRREENLMKRFLAINNCKADENAPWPEHAEQLRALLRGGYLNLDSITSSHGMLDFFASHRVLAHQECLSCCLGIRMTVHYNLFCGTVLALGNDQQRRWLEESQKLGQLGCFMLTEVGAGVLSGLIVETTATWTYENQGGFDLHTPSSSAEKTWISQGLAADWGVVVANLIVEQQNFGPHVFLVEMSSVGVHRESMGEKTTFNALDNARVSFNHVFLQCDALLSKLCSVRLRPTFPDGPLRAEYAFTGNRPPSFVQIAQRLLSGRLCISDSAIAYVEGVLRVTRKYAESRMVWVDKERKMPLSELPYMKKVLHSVEVGLNVHKAFLLLLQKEFAEAIESSQDLSRALVTRIAAAKVEAVEFAIKSLALLRRDVGSYSLMASSPYGSNNDILLCCRFAEGDSRVLQQMLTRDLVKAHSKFPAVARLLWRVLKAWLSGALHSPAKLQYLRDQQLLRLLWDLARQHRQCLQKGMTKAQAETEAWIQAELVYDVAKTHAQQLIHSTVEQQCGRSKDTLRFMDMCISDCEAHHV